MIGSWELAAPAAATFKNTATLPLRVETVRPHKYCNQTTARSVFISPINLALVPICSTQKDAVFWCCVSGRRTERYDARITRELLPAGIKNNGERHRNRTQISGRRNDKRIRTCVDTVLLPEPVLNPFPEGTIMCILGLLLGLRPDLPFLCIHNRDESFMRPVEAPDGASRILFGRDVTAGGTWMGFNRDTGVFVSLTNVARRRDAPPGVVSRGQLVMDLLTDGGSGGSSDGASGAAAADGDAAGSGSGIDVGTPAVGGGGGSAGSSGGITLARLRDAAAGVEDSVASWGRGGGVAVALGGNYAGFNVVTGVVGTGEAWFVTNRPPGALDASGVPALLQLPPGEGRAWRLAPHGVYSLSNSTLCDASWVKVRAVADRLPAALDAGLLPPLRGHDAAADAAAVLRAAVATMYVTIMGLVRKGTRHQIHPVNTTSTMLPPRCCRVDATPLPADGVMADLSWSDAPPELESFLQRHIFIPEVKSHRCVAKAGAAGVCIPGTAPFLRPLTTPTRAQVRHTRQHGHHAAEWRRVLLLRQL